MENYRICFKTEVLFFDQMFRSESFGAVSWKPEELEEKKIDISPPSQPFLQSEARRSFSKKTENFSKQNETNQENIEEPEIIIPPKKVIHSPIRKSIIPAPEMKPHKALEAVISEIKPEPERKNEPTVIGLTMESLRNTVSPGDSVLFGFSIPDNGVDSSDKIQVVDFITSEIILEVRKFSKFGSTQFQLVDIGNPSIIIAQIESNFTRLSYEYRGESESLKVEYKSMLAGSSPNRQFTVDLAQNGSQPQRYIPKPPKIKGGIPVLRFGGRVKMESVKNFILININTPETNTLVFGKASPTQFIGEAMNPLTPLQSILICLTQFK